MSDRMFEVSRVTDHGDNKYRFGPSQVQVQIRCRPWVIAMTGPTAEDAEQEAIAYAWGMFAKETGAPSTSPRQAFAQLEDMRRERAETLAVLERFAACSADSLVHAPMARALENLLRGLFADEYERREKAVRT